MKWNFIFNPQKPREWRRYFCWYPRFIKTGRLHRTLVFFEFVERRFEDRKNFQRGWYKDWEYRLIDDRMTPGPRCKKHPMHPASRCNHACNSDCRCVDYDTFEVIARPLPPTRSTPCPLVGDKGYRCTLEEWHTGTCKVVGIG